MAGRYFVFGVESPNPLRVVVLQGKEYLLDLAAILPTFIRAPPTRLGFRPYDFLALSVTLGGSPAIPATSIMKLPSATPLRLYARIAISLPDFNGYPIIGNPMFKVRQKLIPENE